MFDFVPPILTQEHQFPKDPPSPWNQTISFGDNCAIDESHCCLHLCDFIRICFFLNTSHIVFMK